MLIIYLVTTSTKNIFVDFFNTNALHAYYTCVLLARVGFDQLKRRPSKNALLADICISTSAAPTFFPAHYFETEDGDGRTRAFNLVDGGLAANNPVSTPYPCARTGKSCQCRLY